MNKTLVIDRRFGFTRVAFYEGTELRDLQIYESKACAPAEGNIYLAKVAHIKREIHGAFVHLGDAGQAFLTNAPDSLRPGDCILVQGVAAQRPGSEKQFRVRAGIQLPGRWIVFVPNSEKIGCSSKIVDEARRDELIAWASQRRQPGEGIIFRSEAKDADWGCIAAEWDHLCQEFQRLKRAVHDTHPRLLWSHPQMNSWLCVSQGVKPDEIVTNDSSVFHILGDASTSGLLGTCAVTLDPEEQTLLCDRWGIDRQIEKLLQRKHWLPSGASIVVDPCEAMTVYDVNSGKATQKDSLSLKQSINLEAVRWIIQHIRLSEISGVILVDLIDTPAGEDAKALLQEAERSTESDKDLQIIGITRLGLLEMTRKRSRLSLKERLLGTCPRCHTLASTPTAAYAAYQRLLEARRQEVLEDTGSVELLCTAAEAAEIERLAQTEYKIQKTQKGHGSIRILLERRRT